MTVSDLVAFFPSLDIVALIQTHSESLDWNCHLHLIVTDGAVDYSDASTPVFKPCRFWNFAAMTEMFRGGFISPFRCETLDF